MQAKWDMQTKAVQQRFELVGLLNAYERAVDIQSSFAPFDDSCMWDVAWHARFSMRDSMKHALSELDGLMGEW